jgi:outer membrane lipoprotein-sorting protein
MRQVVRVYLNVPRFKIFISGFVPTFFALVGFLIVSCAPKPKLLPENRTPENVLRCAQKNQIEFETFACLMDLKLKGKEAKFSGTIEFFYKRPDTFSFYPRTFFGMGMFKARGEDDSLTIYFPKQNEFYRGSFSDFEKTGLWSWKISLDMLLKMILGRDGLIEENARYTGNTKDLFLYEYEDENWIKEYWIDSRICRLTKSLWKQKRDGEFYQIEYKNFTTQNHIEIPKVISIKSRTKESARIKFLERKFNPPLPPKKFELKIPPDAKRVDFETSTR